MIVFFGVESLLIGCCWVGFSIDIDCVVEVLE